MERRREGRPQPLLIVNESPELREVWRIWLTLRNFAVDEANNGADAVSKALSAPPRLILIEGASPVAGGIDTIKRLKADSRTAHIPIVAFNSHDGQPDALRALAAGAATFVRDPSDPNVLLDHIRLAMGRSS